MSDSIESATRKQRWFAGHHLIGMAATFLLVAPCMAIDVFGTAAEVSETPQAGLVPGSICVFGPVGEPLLLDEVIERALCENHKTREAWAQVKVASAAVGLAKSAYLPTLSADWQGVRDNSTTDVTNHPTLSSSERSFVRSETVSLSWVLYDFGGRSAALRNAKELLAAAQASQQAELETVFASTAKDYYAAQAAAGNSLAARQIETFSKNSFLAASQRVTRGVAPLSDELQAQTAYVQAVINQTRADADLRSAIGMLAVDLDLSPDTSIGLPSVEDGVEANTDFSQSVSELILEAKTHSPAVIAAEAQLRAAEAKSDQVRAGGRPSISYVTKYSRNNQPASLGLGVPEYPATGHDFYMGVEVSFPLFEGFARTYQVRQAESQTEVALENAGDVRNRAAQDLWSAYQELSATTENLGNSKTLLEVAGQSFEAAQHRYAAGVGGIIELLTAQSSLAAAKRQRIQALTDWRSDRLQLAGSLGRLGIWSLH